MNGTHSNLPAIDIKLYRIMLGMLLATSIILSRLIQLQFVQESALATQSTKNFLRLEKITPARGNITDRNGILLATNRPITLLYWQGGGNPRLSAKQLQQIQILESILSVSILPDNKKREEMDFIERRYKRLLIASDISLAQLGKIKEIFAYNPNLVLVDHFKRYYPYASYASHALGYLGYINNLEVAGKMGLEKELEEALKGISGTKINQVNSIGKQLESRKIQNTCAGKDIQTTIDIDLQNIIETIFPADYAGTMIVMDPLNGDILALLSRPTFDPGIFVNPINQQIWQGLQENQPFINRAFQGCYPPGSLFKLVSLAAALEKNLIDPESIWHCQGRINFGRRTYWCHKRYGHGELNTTQALAQSCNIPFYDIGKRVDIDILAEYAHRFGLGEKTNTLFAEKTGLIPTRAWKKEHRAERWQPGETLSAAIGQSFSLVTPIQISRMISGMVTGMLVRPRFLMSDPIETTPIDIQQKTLDFLQSAMKQVVTRGTGKRINTINDFELYAKTSTAQTCALNKQSLGKQFLPHGWFAAYMRYKDCPPLTIIILLENAGTSRVATMPAKQFLLKYKKLIDEKTVSATKKDEPPEEPPFDTREFDYLIEQEE